MEEQTESMEDREVTASQEQANQKQANPEQTGQEQINPEQAMEQEQARTPETMPDRNEDSRERTPDRTLLELSAGSVCWGVICQITVVWLVKNRLGYSLGLWIGVLLAVLAGIHMWWALDRSLGFAQDSAVKLLTKYNIIRYLVIVIVMGLVMISGFANPLSAFLGLMGLKVSAYIQPFTHKIFEKFKKID